MFYRILVLHGNDSQITAPAVFNCYREVCASLKSVVGLHLPFLYYYDEVQVVITSFVLTDLITAVLFLKFIKIASLHNQVSQMKLKLKLKKKLRFIGE